MVPGKKSYFEFGYFSEWQQEKYWCQAGKGSLAGRRPASGGECLRILCLQLTGHLLILLGLTHAAAGPRKSLDDFVLSDYDGVVKEV